MLSKFILPITAISLGLGLIFDLLFFGKLPGISFPIYVATVLTVLVLTSRWFQKKLSLDSYLLIPFIIFFSSMVYVRAGGLITFLNVVMTLFLMGLFLKSVFRPDIPRYKLVDYLEVVVVLPLQIIEKIIDAITELVGSKKYWKNHEDLKKVLRGIIITLPLLLLFILLFSSADLVFRKYISDIFSFHIDDDIIARTILISVVTAGFMGVLGFLAQKNLSPSNIRKSEIKFSLGPVESTILFTSLNILFLSFIIVQLTYLFGGEKNIVGQGFTYAEYARKGFFELIAVAVFTLGIVLLAEKLHTKDVQKHNTRFKLLSGLLIVQVLIIMVSAFNRLSLYESAYGFTSLRFYSHSSIIWLAVIFFILLSKLFVNQREDAFAFMSFLSIMAFLVAMNLINVDGFVARKNVERYHSIGKIDTNYLVQLSDDGVKNTIILLDENDPTVVDPILKSLEFRKQELESESNHWQSKNLTRDSLLDVLEDKL